MKYKLIILLTIIALECSAQQIDYDFRFVTANERSGLISDQIHCIAADKFGYIWIGTQSGLSRYDGTKFSTVRVDQKNSVAGNSVADLTVDKDGIIWIATERGVNSYNPDAGAFTYYPKYNNDEKTINRNFQCDKIFPQENGDIIVFANYGQAFKLEKDSTIFRPILKTLFDTVPIRNFYIDNEKTFWMLSDKNSMLYQIDTLGNLLKSINCKNTYFPNITHGTYTIYDNGDGNLFFGGEFGIIVYNKKSGRFQQFEVANPADVPLNARVFYRDKFNRLWIGSNAADLHFVDPKDNRIIKIPSSKVETAYMLNSSTVNDITEDNNGLIWFATWKGITYMEMNPVKKFHNISRDENHSILHKNYIYGFDRRKDGVMAIASDGGGVTYWKKGEQNQIECYDPAIRDNTAMESSSTLAVAFDSVGNCYTGGYNRCLTRINADGKTCIAYPYNPDDEECLAFNFVRSILIDKKQRIWVFTNGGGLHLLNPETKKFKRFRYDKDGNYISLHGISVFNSNDGNKLYLCTYQGFQIYDIENNTIETFYNNDSDSTTISHNWVYYAKEDSKGRLWVGTDAGLDLYNPSDKTFTHFNKNVGFENTVINGILEDNNGMFWISTARGLVKFNPEEQVVERTYRTSDGLVAENFEPCSAYKDPDGDMFFGTGKGFLYFNPDEIKASEHMPAPTITGLLINYNRTTRYSEDSPLKYFSSEAAKEIVLNHNQSTFTIEFASFNYVNSKGNRYNCYMQGYDKQWQDIGQRNEITFTNLNSGHYVFMVRGINADGVQSEIKTLNIIINPPKYRTWWAITLQVILIIGITILIYRTRVRTLQKRQKELEETVATRTEQLLSANAELESQKEEIIRQSEEISNTLDKMMIINDLSRQITSTFEVDEIIKKTYQYISEIIKIDFFAIGFYSKSLDSLEFTQITQDKKIIKNTTIKVSENYAENTCYNDKKDVLLFGQRCKQSVFYNAEKSAQTSLCVPLESNNKAIGLFAINTLQPNAYTSTDLVNIRMISSVLSIAIDKAKDYQLLRTKNNNINGSIKYAKTIQDAVLVHKTELDKYFKSAIIFKPKDIVSGDFYWMRKIGNNPQKPKMIFVAVIDCTGHGVPGAFMSLISNILLSDIVIRTNTYEPDKILSALNDEIINILNQDQNTNDDGLDMAICRFDRNENGQIYQAVYAGAKNSIYYYSSATDAYSLIPADRISIGGVLKNSRPVFTPKTFAVQKDDIIYMNSDGIIDQNNQLRKRFGRIKFQDVLTQVRKLPMDEQKTEIELALKNHMGNEEQRDDITILGLKIID